ncbi:hypothetical protein GF325_09625 [Candidatus Bathyarchaeota archaeon]|nr:hypothetical protein [Candidatus Bathyarchaeota archaeon]
MEQRYEIPSDPSIEFAKQALFDELASWLDASRNRHEGTPWKGVHDEGTFLTSWREYDILIPDSSAREFALERFEAASKWSKEKLPDGYHKRQEVHHGTEHFTIFLAWLLEIDPGCQPLLDQLWRAALHIVHQGKKRRPWYNFGTNRFTSMFLGSKRLGRDKLNIVEHLRMVRLAWLGLARGRQEELEQFILAYAGEWARQIRDSIDVPVFLDDDKGKKKHRQFKKALFTFIGAAPKHLDTRSRSEIHVANGTPDLFLHLHEKTGNAVFLDAAERIIAPVHDQLCLPYAHPLGELCWRLQREGRLDGLQESIKKARDQYNFLAPGTKISFNPAVNWSSDAFQHFKNAIGMRNDMARIIMTGENGKVLPAPLSPGTLVLLHRYTGDERFLVDALLIARAALGVYRTLYKDGRFHGCSSRTVSAGCVGHGRNWGAGYVSTALRGLLPGIDTGIALPDIPIK